MSKFYDPEKARKVAAFTEAVAAVEEKFGLTLDLPRGTDREGLGVIDKNAECHFAIVRGSSVPGDILLGMGAER